MNTSQNMRLINSIIKYKIAGIRTPAVVSYLLTQRCPRNCIMCGSSDKTVDEMPTEEALRIIDNFAAAGMIKMIFTGGEVFVHDDFDLLVDRCVSHGVSVNVNTSGYHIREKRNILKKIDSLHLSLDGPEEINDSVRYKGSYQDVIDVIDFGKSQGTRMVLMCTINSQNVERLGDVSEFARKRQVPMSFHIAGDDLLRNTGKNPARLKKPMLKQAIREIQKLKKDNPYIANSNLSLKLFEEDNFARKIKCMAGHLFVRMNPDGQIKGCGWDVWTPKNLNARDMSVDDMLKRIPEMKCDLCLCESRFELNLAVDRPVWAFFQHMIGHGHQKGMKDQW